MKTDELTEEELKEVPLSVLERAKSFGSTMMKTLFLRATRGKEVAFVSPELLEKRWNTCLSCKHLEKVAKDKYICAQCGCRCSGEKSMQKKYMNKLANYEATCPIKLWGPKDYIKAESESS